MNAKITQRCSKGNTEPLCTDSKVRGRNWCFTSFEKTPPAFEENAMGYLIVGEEICPETGNKHWQCYVNLINACTRQAFSKKYSLKWHVEKMKGTSFEAAQYCKKDGKFSEYGKLPQPGERKDLTKLKDEILAGKSVDSITLENPAAFHQYGRTLERIETLRNRNIWRTEMTKGIWLHGKTGVGKSHYAFQDYHPDTHYNWCDDGGWWDGYKGQKVVIINDFRGQIKYDELLKLIDKWPMTVRRRGAEPWPFTAEKIIITSSLTPEECYHNRLEKDSIEQLLRRIEIVNLV